ncbi:tetratricopeptide repeat protein [Belliella marina]|uniref:Tetratricopeptide repeat protein n=1 Tax=Belliella marina TaxID=1644146 RepID=A0ABW4VM87_9BACT
MCETRIIYIENHWKKLTLTANDQFNKKGFENALLVYENALSRAEILAHYHSECQRLNIPFMQVYIISCNNISNTYKELGQFEEAEKMLRRVIFYLLHLSNQEGVDIQILQSELKKATLSLLDFVQNHFGKTQQEKLFQNLKSHFKDNEIAKFD